MAIQEEPWYFSSHTAGQRDQSAAVLPQKLIIDPWLVVETFHLGMRGELEKILESVVEKKGKRDIKPSAVKVAEDSNKIENDAFPADFIIVLITIEDEGVALCVKPGDRFTVVGLSD